MKHVSRRLLLSLCLFFTTLNGYSLETEFTPVLKATSVLADPKNDTLLYNPKRDLFTANEIGLRLNWNIDFDGSSGAIIHLKNQLFASNNAFNSSYKQALFRYKSLAHSYTNDNSGELQYDLFQEVDRLVYFTSINHFSLYAGRQAISWGLGRFWQPLDIFGAFPPLALDREYKAGIDALNLVWYPSNFSQLNLVYVATNQDIAKLDDSYALLYQQQINLDLFITVLAARLLENTLFGVGIDTGLGGAGIRAESVGFQWNDEWQAITLLSLDYQFKNEIILTLEYLHQSSGATNQAELNLLSADQLVLFGLQKQLSQSVMAIGLQKTLFPLLDVSYVNLISYLDESNRKLSSLQQLSFIYSTSNESDLTLSLMGGMGETMANSILESEFGHIPLSITAQFRHYF